MRTRPRIAATAMLVLLAAGQARAFDYAAHWAEQRRVQQAYAEVMRSCAARSLTVDIQPSYGSSTARQLTISRTEWSGGCAGDLTDGDGAMSIQSRTSDGKPFYSAMPPERWRGQGTMVRGRKVGPWLNLVWVTPLEQDQQFWTVGLYTWDDAIYAGQYRRGADGDYTPVAFSYPSDALQVGADQLAVRVRAGVPVISAVAAAQQKNASIAAASGSGVVEGRMLPKVALPMLEDLLPGGLVARSPGAPLRGTRGKSAVLLLSRDTPQAFRNIDSLRERLQAYAGQVDASQRAQVSRMAALADSRTLARDLATILRAHFQSLEVVTDLRGFLASPAELAMVLDLRFEYQADLLARISQEALKGAQDAPLQGADTLSYRAGYVLLNRQLEVESAMPEPEMSRRPMFLSTGKDALSGSLKQLSLRLTEVFGEPSAARYPGMAASLSRGLLLSDD